MEYSVEHDYKPERFKVDDVAVFNKMEENIDRICRVCLITEVTMYKIEGPLKDYLTAIMDASNFSNILPKYICYECRWLIHKFQGFRMRCQQAQYVFLKLLNDYKVVTKKTIREEHRISIQSSLSFATTTEDHIINITFNDDVDVFGPAPPSTTGEQTGINDLLVPKTEPDEGDQLMREQNNVWLMFSDPSEDLDHHSDVDDALSTKEETEIKTEKIKCKKTKSSLKPKKKKKLKVTQKKKKESLKGQKKKKEDIRDEDGLKPEEADLRTHFNITFLTTLEEQRAEIERRKESANYRQCRFRCEVCYKGFSFEKTYTNHAAKHKPEWGEFPCPVCGIRFPIARFLRTHLRTHERIYSCTLCHYVTTHLDPAKRHKLYHIGVTYTCEHCGVVIKRKTSYHNHIRKKHPPSEFVCSECGFSFISEKGLKMHITITHRNDSEESEKVAEERRSPKSWECESCSLSFRSQTAYRRHHTTHHATDSEAALKLCRTCGIRFPSHRELREHNAETHPEEVAARAFRARTHKYFKTYPLLCTECGEEIPNRQKHWRHYQKAHFKLPYPIPRNFICETCGKGFKLHVQLVYHRRTHFPERQYRCPCCPKTFHNRGNMSLHILTHDDSRSFCCEHCGKSFKRKQGLAIHLKNNVCSEDAAEHRRGLRKSCVSKAAENKRKHKRKMEPLPFGNM